MRSCLIADDHALVREALAATVARHWPDVAVTEASDFPAAWQAAAETVPDLCLLDLDMPGAAPLDGVDRLRAASPDTRIVIFTGACDDATMLALLDRCVAGLADKTVSAAILVAALELVLAGGRYLPPRLAELHLTLTAEPGPAPARPPMSGRQLEVLRLIALGRSNKDIARELAVSPATVKTHVASIIAATGAANRTEAVFRARDRYGVRAPSG